MASDVNSHSVLSGSPIVTNKRVLAIAVPMTLAYLTTPLIGIVDTYLIGQLGDAAAIGGIAVGALLFNMIFTTFNFLRTSTTALTAQALGEKAFKQIDLVLFRGLLLSAIFGILAIAFHYPLIYLGIWGVGAQESVNAFIWTYLTIRIISAPLTLANYTFAGWFMGQAMSWTAFVQQFILNCANIGFSAFFVLYLDMGVAGAALGTIIGELMGFVVGIGAVFYLKRPSKLSFSEITNPIALKQMMSMNGNIMIRSFVLLGSFYIFTSMSARQGTTVLAANEVLLHFFYISGYFLDGCAVAAEQLCGQAKGARDRFTFRKAAILTGYWNIALASLLSISFIAAIPAFVHMVTPNLDVQTIALDYQIWAILTPVLGVLAFQMDGIYFGAGWVKTIRNQMLVSLIIFVILVWLTRLIFEDKNDALWISFNLFLAMRGGYLLLAYKSNETKTFSQ